MRRTTVRVDGSQLAEARTAPRPAAIAGAVVCAGVAVLLAATTALVTFGLSESYGFGPGWDVSAFVMTGGAGACGRGGGGGGRRHRRGGVCWAPSVSRDCGCRPSGCWCCPWRQCLQ